MLRRSLIIEMKKWIQILGCILLVLSVSQLQAQYGVRATYNLNHAPSWEDFFQTLDSRNTDLFASSLSFEVDYWLRLPNHRIEFYPYLSYHQANSEIWTNDQLTTTPQTVGLRQLGAGLISHIYIFDLIGDCDCPTFSKQGGFFKKGFFILGGIGVVHSDKRISDNFDDGNLDFSARLGAGIDIGLTDLITISPFAQVQYFPSVSWHELGATFQTTPEHIESSLGQLQFGIRVGFRPDYGR